MSDPRGHRRGAIVWAAIGTLILVVPLGDIEFTRGNLPVLAGNPPLLLPIVGLPATQGILVGVAVWYFHADLWEGAGLGLKIGILYGVIFFVIFVIVNLTGVSARFAKTPVTGVHNTNLSGAGYWSLAQS